MLGKYLMSLEIMFREFKIIVGLDGLLIVWLIYLRIIYVKFYKGV